MNYISPCGGCGHRAALNDDSQLFEVWCYQCDYRRLLDKEEKEEEENEFEA